MLNGRSEQIQEKHPSPFLASLRASQKMPWMDEIQEPARMIPLKQLTINGFNHGYQSGAISLCWDNLHVSRGFQCGEIVWSIPNGCYISFVPQWFPPWFSPWCNITSLGRLLLIAPSPPCSHRDPFDPSNSSRRQLHSAQGQHGMPLFGAPTCRLRARSLPEAEMGRCWSTRKRRWVGAPLKLLGT